jgi:glycosyltransferase involved in cell wall biosynthesis
MRVGIHVPPLEPISGGGFTFVASVLGALARNPGRHSFVVLHRDLAEELPYRGLRLVRVPDGSSVLDETLDATVRAERIDVVWFSTPGIEPVSVPFIATVWDLEHRNQPYFPEVSVSGWDWDERELLYRSTLPRAAMVLTGTEEGRRQIQRYYAVPEERIVVAPLPTPSFEEENRAPPELAVLLGGLPQPYVFYPAQFWPHKNHVALLHALRLLRDDHGMRLSAVFTGSDKGNRAHVEETVRALDLESQVRFLGFVERGSLVALYRGALALVYPSFFGPDNLPPLEAFSIGCPVIAARARGVPDQLGEAPLYFEPSSEQQLAAALLRLVREPDLREELARRGRERSARGTAADYVATVIAWLDEFEKIRRCWSRDEPYIHT